MTTIRKLGAATAAAALLCSFTGAAFAGEHVSRPHGNDKVELFVAAGSAPMATWTIIGRQIR